MGRADGRQEGGSEEVVSSSPLSSSPLSTDVQATEALPLYGTTVYALGRDGVMTITETTSVTTVTTSTTTTTPAAATSAGARTTGASSATAMDTGVADAAAFGISSDAISSDASATEERRRAGAGVDYILEAGGAAGAGRAAQRKAGGLRGREGWSVGGASRGGRRVQGGHDRVWLRGGGRGRRRGLGQEEGGEGEEEEEEGGAGLEGMLSRHPRRHYIIPPAIARPLVLSSQMLLLQAVAALWVCMRGAPPLTWGLPPLLLGTYLTSTNFWSCPTTSSPWRYLDYAMVASSVLYGTLVVKVAAPPALIGMWCRGWGAVGVLFVANEAKFWLNKSKTRKDYTQAVWVHLLAVHLGGNALVGLALAALARFSPLLEALG